MTAVALVTLIAACSGGGSAPQPSTAPPGRSTTVAQVTTTSTSSTSSTTAAPATTTTEALTPQATPDAAAKTLLDAWRRGDRVAALHVATPAAVDALFATPPQTYSDRGCQDPSSGNSACAFGVGNGLAQLQTASRAGGWIVQSVTVNP